MANTHTPLLAPQWAINRANEIVQPGEQILATWVVSDENRSNAIKRKCLWPFGCPIFWPHAIIFSPCLCAHYRSSNAILKGMVYVVTDKRLYRSIDTEKAVSSSCVCCTPGRDSGDVLLTDINGITVDNPGKCCGMECLPIKAVGVGLPLGHPLANAGVVYQNNEQVVINKHLADTYMPIYVDDPEAVVRLLREAKDHAAASFAAPAAMVVATPVAAADMTRDDPIYKIKVLKGLLDAGAVTQQEYDLKKAKLLGVV